MFIKAPEGELSLLDESLSLLSLSGLPAGQDIKSDMMVVLSWADSVIGLQLSRPPTQLSGDKKRALPDPQALLPSSPLMVGQSGGIKQLSS